MANPEHLAKLREGVKAWNQWRKEHPDIRPDLTGADPNGADLSGANLNAASLFGADLSWAKLNGVDLGGATLILANLNGAKLSGSDFGGADVGSTVFADVDLGAVKGLGTVNHIGPSTIGIDTIVKSKGNIPEIFLRGAGVPEPFITEMKALIGAMEPIQFYSCFISHSTKDQKFADRLYADLQSKNLRCWYAPGELKGGRYLHDQIDEAIRVFDKLLLILSHDSMKSDWVKMEIVKAREKEKREGKRVLFPLRLVPFQELQSWICLHPLTGEDLAAEVRKYFIPDFSNWKDRDKDHDYYQAALDHLLRDLKAEGADSVAAG